MSAPTTAVASSPTPILDRLAPMPGPRKPRRLPSFFAPLIVVLSLYALPSVLISLWPQLERSFFEWLARSLNGLFAGNWAGVRVVLTGFGFAAIFLVAVGVHECGHLLAGLAMGFHFRALRVWRVQIDRNLRFSRYQPREREGLGWVRFSSESMRNRPLRIGLMIFAGPFANLISGFLLLAVAFPKSFLAGSFIGISFFLGFGNLLPFRQSSTTTDGMRLLILWWNRPKYERWLALAKILEDRAAGIELEQLSNDLIATVTGVRDKSMETVVAHTIAYAAAYSQHRDNDAAQLLETCLRYSSYATPALRESSIANAGIFQAERRNRNDLARQWLADLPTNPKASHTRLMLEGAILEAEKDYVGALQKVDEIKRTILATTEPGQRVALAHFEKWKGELEKKVASTSWPVPAQ